MRKASGSAAEQLFKYNAEGAVSPAQIALTAHAANVSIARWQYRNASGEWTDYPTTSDNTAINGATLNVKPTHSVFVGDGATLPGAHQQRGRNGCVFHL